MSTDRDREREKKANRPLVYLIPLVLVALICALYYISAALSVVVGLAVK